MRDGSVCAICRRGGGKCLCDELTRVHGVYPIPWSAEEEDEPDGQMAKEQRAKGPNTDGIDPRLVKPATRRRETFEAIYLRWLNDPAAHSISVILACVDERAASQRALKRQRNYDARRGKGNKGTVSGWKKKSLEEARAAGLPAPRVNGQMANGQSGT